jgi:hypothetical protein
LVFLKFLIFRPTGGLIYLREGPAGVFLLAGKAGGLIYLRHGRKGVFLLAGEAGAKKPR